MSFCYSCAATFGVFNKQLGCKNCGFAFCKKCLTKKTAVPKLNNEKTTVCNKCFDLLTGKSMPVHIAPPDAFNKRLLAASQANQAVPVQSKKGLSQEDAALVQRLEKLKEDRRAAAPTTPSQAEIENRMQKLKKERMTAVPSESEIAERLAAVRGQDPNRPSAAASSVVTPQIRKTQPEQVDDLLDEISNEVVIDSRFSSHSGGFVKNDLSKEDLHPRSQDCPTYNISTASSTAASAGDGSDLSEIDRMMREAANEMKIDAKRKVEGLKRDKELWDRVQRLKTDRNSATHLNETKQEEYSPFVLDDGNEENDEDDEKATKKIIQKLMEEQCLDEEYGYNSGDKGSSSRKAKSDKSKLRSSPDEQEDDDELPWCCICNNDAGLRCKGCDGDLYCNRCYRECHDRQDLKDHQTFPYRT